MVTVGLYIYVNGIAKRVELFDDEKISITSSVQDIADISKIKMDYSQSFTVPATEKNNVIFSHWYENSIDNGFDAGIRKDSYIELDTIPFRKGKIQLEKASIKNGYIQNYSITFFGGLLSLKDLLKDKYLRDLNFSSYAFNYTGDDIKNRITGGLDNNIKFPLITSKNVWQYGGGGTTESNWDITQSATPIKTTDLFPAMRISEIMKVIQNDLGISFQGSFLSNPRFTNAFLWLKNTDTFVKKSDSKIIDFTSVTSGYESIFDLATNTFNYTIPSYPSYVITSSLAITTTTTGVPFKLDIYLNGKLNYSVNLVTNNSTQSVNIGLSNSGKYQFYISSDTALTFSTNYHYVEGYDEYDPYNSTYNQIITSDLNAISASQTITILFDVAGYMPEMKVEDFFTGILKMYNLTCYSNEPNIFQVKQLEDWYYEGKILDISKYIISDEFAIDRVPTYKTIKFEFEKSQNLLSVAYLSNSTVGYGDLFYQLNNDGSEYNVKLPFENMLFNKFTGTNLTVGYSLKSDLKPYIPKPLIMYDYGISQSATFYLDTGSSVAQVTNYNSFGEETKIGLDTFGISFGVEQSVLTGQTIDNTLFKKYYLDYLNNIYNVKTRKISAKAVFPISLLTSINLNDRVIIRDKRYIINNIVTDLTTGEVDLSLLTDFRSLENPNPTNNDYSNADYSQDYYI
jgi:hypothetical protein